MRKDILNNLTPIERLEFCEYLEKKLSKVILFCFVILMILLILIPLARAEEIPWQAKNGITIENCMNESNQSEVVCKEIVKLMKISEKYGTVETTRIFEEG